MSHGFMFSDLLYALEGPRYALESGRVLPAGVANPFLPT